MIKIMSLQTFVRITLLSIICILLVIPNASAHKSTRFTRGKGNPPKTTDHFLGKVQIYKYRIPPTSKLSGSVIEIVWDYVLDNLETVQYLLDQERINGEFFTMILWFIPAMMITDFIINIARGRVFMTAEERIDEKYDVGVKSMEDTIREQNSLKKRQMEGQLKKGGFGAVFLGEK